MSAGPITLRTPNDLLTLLPYLVQEPSKGMVALTFRKGQVGSLAVYDLDRAVNTDPATVAEKFVASAKAEGADMCIVVGYGTREQITTYIDHIIAATLTHGLPLKDALRVHEGRYWSYRCEQPGCCPAEGSPIDADRSTAPAEAVLRGASPVPRATEPRTLEAFSIRSQEVEEATAKAERLLSAITQHGPRKQMVLEAIAAERVGTGPQDVTTLVRLAVCVRDVKVRDVAGSQITPETAHAHRELWERVTRTAAPDDRAAPACLAAIAAWLDGDMPAAQVAVNTALKTDPGYSLAQNMREALALVVPTQAWVARVEDLD